MMMFYPGIHWDSETEKAHGCCEHQWANQQTTVTPSEEVEEMVTETAVEVKPKQPLFAVGDPEAKLSLAYAKDKGYILVLAGDGEAEVTNAEGRSYYIQKFECDCPDKRARGGSYSGRCKHEIWIGQMRPCEMCGSIMYMGAFQTAFAETLKRFECPACGNTRDADLVREERKALREGGPEDERLTPEGRCQQAIAWLKKKDTPRYVWLLVRQSPDLAPLMIRLLAVAEQGELADAIAKTFTPLVDPVSPEQIMRDRIRKAEAALLKLPKGRSLLTGLLEYLELPDLKHIPSDKLADTLGLCEQVFLSATR